MGLSLVEKLIQKQTEYSKDSNLEKISIYVINRGKIYWNGLFYEIINGKPNVYHFISDRTDLEQFQKCLYDIKSFIKKSDTDLIEKNDNIILFDYILDYTCYKKDEVRFLLENLDFSFTTYLLISTDSTYNASELSLKRDFEYFFQQKDNPTLVKEEEALWCENKEIRKKLKKRDEYGYNKLKCEIELKRLFSSLKLKEQGKNYYFLRLPDVLGTYDESYRLWYYIEWVKYSHINPIEVEKEDLYRKLSFVEKEDVIDLIIRIVFNKYEKTLDFSLCANQEYNLGCAENITLMDLLDFISSKLNIKYQFEVKEQNALTYYPSVTFGPVCIDKAINILNFKPRKLKESLENEFEFFQKCGEIYKKEHDEMIKDLAAKIKNSLKK